MYTARNNKLVTVIERGLQSARGENLQAVREDLAEWINSLLGTSLDDVSLMSVCLFALPTHGFKDLATGVILCDLATLIEETGQHPTDEQRVSSQVTPSYFLPLCCRHTLAMGDLCGGV